MRLLSELTREQAYKTARNWLRAARGFQKRGDLKARDHLVAMAVSIRRVWKVR